MIEHNPKKQKGLRNELIYVIEIVHFRLKIAILHLHKMNQNFVEVPFLFLVREIHLPQRHFEA